MREKRFTMYKNDHTLIDNLTGHICEFPNQKYAETCCKWLNELWGENEQLKEELQRFKKYVFSEDNILCYKCEHCIKKDIYVVDCEMKGKVDVHGICSLFREVKV